MIDTDIIETEKGAALGIKINLPKAPLLLIIAEKGFICCGYFNKDTIEKLNQAAVIVKGVRTFKQMLSKQPDYVSKKARKLGAKKKMKTKQILNLLV